VTLNYEGFFEVSRCAEGVTEVLADPDMVFPALPRFHSMRLRHGESDKIYVKLKIGPAWFPAVGTTRLALTQNYTSGSFFFDGTGALIGRDYQVSVKLGVNESRMSGTVVDWAGTVCFHRRHVELFGKERMQEFVEYEISDAVEGIRLIL
jgi:carbon monoxide dehydrogenase subunit G